MTVTIFNRSHDIIFFKVKELSDLCQFSSSLRRCWRIWGDMQVFSSRTPERFTPRFVIYLIYLIYLFIYFQKQQNINCFIIIILIATDLFRWHFIMLPLIFTIITLCGFLKPNIFLNWYTNYNRPLELAF